MIIVIFLNSQQAIMMQNLICKLRMTKFAEGMTE